MCGCQYCVYFGGWSEGTEKETRKGEREAEREGEKEKGNILRELRLFAVQKICLQLVKGRFAK